MLMLYAQCCHIRLTLPLTLMVGYVQGGGVGFGGRPADAPHPVCSEAPKAGGEHAHLRR